jgi:hypothetical protein
MEVRVNTYGGDSKILYDVDSMESMPVTVSDSGVTPDAKGRKIVKAGTLIGGGGVGVLKDKDLLVSEANSADCEGVLLYDTDVTAGPTPGSMVYKGNIKLANIPAAPVAAAAEKLPMVRFLA